jgi:hypothetical protein
MLNKRKIKIILTIVSLILMSACSSNKQATTQSYTPLNLKGKSKSFIAGARDGCETAYIKYKKNHEAFNNDYQYNKGWWLGRRNCEGREIYMDDE